MMAYVSSSGYTTIQATGNYTTTGNTLYPEFWVAVDQDIDGIPDTWEEQIAEKFKPVLHKHSYDKQPDLANFDDVLNGYMTLSGWTLQPRRVYGESDVPPLHVWWGEGGGDSFGKGTTPTSWKLDLNDNVRHTGAAVGNRPLYYHVYKQGSYYYVQYWYFLTMNDITDMTLNNTWHEGDWEHVSIKLNKNGNSFTPVAVNFYRHEGGRTVHVQDCWWSSSNALTYSGIQKWYDESHTHLHIWLAANSHSSYNRYDLVKKIVVDTWINGTEVLECYWDLVDYEPSGHDLYFPYDYLDKMGEVKCETSCERHGSTWLYHYDPSGNSKEWLAFVGRIGDFWTNGLTSTVSPCSPSMWANNSHEWTSFTEDYSTSGFGNESTSFLLGNITADVSWIDDGPFGD